MCICKKARTSFSFLSFFSSHTKNLLAFPAGTIFVSFFLSFYLSLSFSLILHVFCAVSFSRSRLLCRSVALALVLSPFRFRSLLLSFSLFPLSLPFLLAHLLFRSRSVSLFFSLEWDGLWKRNCFKVWKRSDLAADDRVFTSRYVYKLKRDAISGKVSRFKARLIVQGFKVDYNDTFSPTPGSTATRTIISIATAEDLELHSVDFTQAFV